MLNWIIDTSLRHRFAVIALALALVGGGVVSMRYLDIDAFPDTTPVQVQVNTVAPALGPEEVEQRITFPIEQVIGGLPRLEQLRSVSKFGLSQVVVTFEDGTDIYFARQLINERLGTVELPPGIEHPKLGRFKIVNQAVKLSRTPASVKTATPDVGEHTDEILGENGVFLVRPVLRGMGLEVKTQGTTVSVGLECG